LRLTGWLLQAALLFVVLAGSGFAGAARLFVLAGSGGEGGSAGLRV